LGAAQRLTCTHLYVQARRQAPTRPALPRPPQQCRYTCCPPSMRDCKSLTISSNLHHQTAAPHLTSRSHNWPTSAAQAATCCTGREISASLQISTLQWHTELMYGTTSAPAAAQPWWPVNSGLIRALTSHRHSYGTWSSWQLYLGSHVQQQCEHRNMEPQLEAVHPYPSPITLSATNCLLPDMLESSRCAAVGPRNFQLLALTACQ